MDKLKEKITAIAEERFKETDLSDCFLVDICQNGSKLEVFIDSDEGVRFWQCQKLSRSIEAYLDESGIIGPKYTLEVSSPGIGRPLKFIRQYVKNIGRQVKVSLIDGSAMEGELTEVGEDKITILKSQKSGKKSKAKGKVEKEAIELKLADIEETKILITFSK
ncbi:MAG: hypothetical protein HKN67_06510 [Saprospiraceae bacterium]|nr:hypothetical protein [Bacteroidia bacterium]NNF21574.1 hypothetical protein [Saprospiraceae bacterium]NNK89752.1 hypothetical protein [Saprospiraceae bacterium]